MKTSIFLIFLAYLQACSALMKVTEFFANGLDKCYDPTVRDSRSLSRVRIHGQDLPLPNSVETFIALIEKYESVRTNIQPDELARKLLQSFRVDNLYPDVREKKLKSPLMNQPNEIKRIIFNVLSDIRYDFEEDDFTEDEKCALHFMLSHTINDTRQDGDDPAEFDAKLSKQPRETGVVSLYSKNNHAIALGRVLLGIGAAYLPNKDVDTNSILQKMSGKSDGMLTNVKVNPVYAVTFGDLMQYLIVDDDPKILPNGLWNDISCPIDYRLDDNNNAGVSNSEIRGAIDGLIIGKKIQEFPDAFKDYRLSQILRMYYSYPELPTNDGTRWCYRERIFSSIDMENEMMNFNLLVRTINGEGSVDAKSRISIAVGEIKNAVFKDIDTAECSITETSPDKKYSSPTNIFAVMDYTATSKLNFQIELIGNLSKDFDIRPHGNLFGVYTNLKPLQSNSLDTIVKNTGVSGCPSCFAKYYSKSASKEEESEVLKDLNHTLTNFEEEYEELRIKYQETTRSGSPGKVLLYFNFGNPTDDYRLSESISELKRHFRGLTILAVGDNKDKLSYFTDDDETDVFTGTTNAEAMAKRIKQRLYRVPGEFLFKECNQSSPSKEAENVQVVYITPGKTQYWAMYPQYFLKSFGISLKFRALEGTQIKVCFSRYFSTIADNSREADCKDSAGEEIKFYLSNPCKKRNVFNCNPFYFSVEGKKMSTQATQPCKSIKCSTPKDIRFEFEHTGISCNGASYAAISYLGLLLAAVLFFIQRH